MKTISTMAIGRRSFSAITLKKVLPSLISTSSMNDLKNGVHHMVTSNGYLLPSLLKCPDPVVGIIAMHTKAGGMIDESFLSFVRLLDADVPKGFRIIGAFKVPIKIALITRAGVPLGKIKGVVAHPEALKVCAKKIEDMRVKSEGVQSNSQALGLLREVDDYRLWASLGPAESAGEGFQIIDPDFSDSPAVTTFYLVDTGLDNVVKVPESDMSRVLVTLGVNEVGSLVDVLSRFKSYNINRFQTCYLKDGRIGIGVEFDVPRSQVVQLVATVQGIDVGDGKMRCYHFPVVDWV